MGSLQDRAKVVLVPSLCIPLFEQVWISFKFNQISDCPGFEDNYKILVMIFTLTILICSHNFNSIWTSFPWGIYWAACVPELKSIAPYFRATLIFNFFALKIYNSLLTFLLFERLVILIHKHLLNMPDFQMVQHLEPFKIFWDSRYFPWTVGMWTSHKKFDRSLNFTSLHSAIFLWFQ